MLAVTSVGPGIAEFPFCCNHITSAAIFIIGSHLCCFLISTNVALYRSLSATFFPFIDSISFETAQLTNIIVLPKSAFMTVCKDKSFCFTLFLLFSINGVALSVHEVHSCNFLGRFEFKAFFVDTFDRT